MRKLSFHLSFSLLPFCVGAIALLSVAYIGLIAIVMSYAALTIEFSQSARDGESAVAVLEGRYLEAVGRITATDYLAEGYTLPVKKTFVKAKSATALR